MDSTFLGTKLLPLIPYLIKTSANWTIFEAMISFKRVVFPVPGGPFTENIFSFLSFSDIAMFIAICCINVGENFDGYFPIGNLSTSNHFFMEQTSLSIIIFF